MAWPDKENQAPNAPATGAIPHRKRLALEGCVCVMGGGGPAQDVVRVDIHEAANLERARGVGQRETLLGSV